MDERQKRALQRASSSLLKDLRFADVQDHLLSREVISQDDLDDIKAEATRKGRILKLLKLLPHRGQQAFTTLVEALRRDQSWLADELESHMTELNDSKSATTAEALEEVLRAGAVPSLPAYHIERAKCVTEIRDRLGELKEGRFLGVYGMPGIGKSVCVNDALRDSNIVLDRFPGGVFWVSVGQVDQEVLINKMQALCERMSDDQTVSQLPPTIDIAVEKLRKLLNRKERRQCLLVLDDVWKKDVLSVFDLGACVLVTTRDASVLDRVDGRAALVQMKGGFSLAESRTLFARRLDIPQESLPEEADDVHNRCGGVPMVIALLSTYLAGKTRNRESRNRWKNCLDNLKQANYEKLQSNIMDAIELSVKSLDEEHARYFRTLAVFGADISIPCQVLCTFWNMSSDDVEDTMTDLVKKSLVQDMWDSKMVTMLYSMHDLIVDYMDKKYSAEEKAELHGQLIARYRAECKDDFGRIPDDEYMLWFIGQHVYKSGQHELFPKLYFDLGFVGNKLRVTGPSDLLSDYRKYAEFLDQNATDTRRRDFENFVRTAGHRVPGGVSVSADPTAAVVQLALCQPDTSAVYRAAWAATREADHQLYFRWCNKEEMRWSNVLLTKVFSGAVCDVAFTHEPDLALTAYGEGHIKLWNVLTGDEYSPFHGHSERVQQLTVSPSGDRFVSASEDHSLKIWDLAEAIELAQVSSGQRTPSPRVRHSSSSLFSYPDQSRRLSSVMRDESHLTLTGHQAAVVCVDWAPNGHYLLSGDADGTVKVWDAFGEEVHSLPEAHENNITCCSFSPDSSYFATGSADGRVKLWQTSDATLLYTFSQHKLRVISLSLSRDNNSIVSVADKEIFCWVWSADRRPSRDFVPLQMRSSPMDHDLYLCSRLSHDQRQLVVGTSSNMYETWDLHERRVTSTQRGFAGSVTSLVFSHDGERLLAGAGDMVTSCCLTTTPKVEDSLQPLFSARFVTADPDSLVVAAITSNNGVQVLRGLKGNIAATTKPVGEKVIITEINEKGTMVAFGCEDGSVGVYAIPPEVTKGSANGACLPEPNILGKHVERVISLQFGPGNAVISGSEDKTMKVWWPDKTSVTYSGNDGAVTQVGLYEADDHGLIAVSCSRDGTLKVYRADTGKLLAAHLTHFGSTVTCYRIVRSRNLPMTNNGAAATRQRSPCPPDLVVVTAAVDGTVKMSHLSTGDTLKTFALEQYGPVRTFQLSADGRLLVTGHDEGHVVVTRTDSTCSPCRLDLHQSMVYDLAVSPDGCDIISLGDSLAWWRISMDECGGARGRSGVRMPMLPSSPRLAPPEKRYINFSRRQSVQPPEIKVELRQVFAFRGTLARRLAVSNDWTTIVTIDDAGVLYVVQVM